MSLLTRRCSSSFLFVGGDGICKSSGFASDGISFCFRHSFTFWIMGIGGVAGRHGFGDRFGFNGEE
jgi:hypothetical protein